MFRFLLEYPPDAEDNLDTLADWKSWAVTQVPLDARGLVKHVPWSIRRGLPPYFFHGSKHHTANNIINGICIKPVDRMPTRKFQYTWMIPADVSDKEAEDWYDTTVVWANEIDEWWKALPPAMRKAIADYFGIAVSKIDIYLLGQIISLFWVTTEWEVGFNFSGSVEAYMPGFKEPIIVRPILVMDASQSVILDWIRDPYIDNSYMLILPAVCRQSTREVVVDVTHLPAESEWIYENPAYFQILENPIYSVPDEMYADPSEVY